MRTIKLIIAIWALAALIAGIFGDISVAGEIGSTSAGFLKIGVGARALGMGGAFTSVADDPSAIYWNPAGIHRMENSKIQFSHYSWYQDIKIENLQIAFSGDRFSYGAGITYLDFGEMQSYDEFGNPGDELSMHDLAAVLTFSGELTDNLSVGVSAKYIEQSFDIVKGSAFAGDFGVMADYRGVRFGLAAVNIGSKITFDVQKEDLPAAIRAGLSFRRFNNRALFAFDLHSPFKGDVSFHQGLEVRIVDQLFARTGVMYQTNTLPGDEALNYNLGLGIAYGTGRFDYTFSPSDEFGTETVHNFSISVGW